MGASPVSVRPSSDDAYGGDVGSILGRGGDHGVLADFADGGGQFAGGEGGWQLPPNPGGHSLVVAEGLGLGELQAVCQRLGVTQLGMGIQGEVVAEEVDIVLDERCDPVVEGASEGAGPVKLPEETVVNDEGVGILLGRYFGGIASSGYGEGQLGELLLSLYLQSIGPIILKLGGVKKLFQVCLQSLASDSHRHQLYTFSRIWGSILLWHGPPASFLRIEIADLFVQLFFQLTAVSSKSYNGDIEIMDLSRKRICFAVLGCGRISHEHFNAIKKCDRDIDLVAVCDVDKEKAELAAHRTGARCYTDLEKMLNNEDLDMVVVATPNCFHPQHAMQVADHHVHVLTEKPMAIKLEDGIKMKNHCEEKGVQLYILYQNRFNETSQALYEACCANRFGQIYLITSNLFWMRPPSYYEGSNNWRGHPKY